MAVALVLTGPATLGSAVAPTTAASEVIQSAVTGVWSSQPPSGVRRQEVTYTASGGRFYLAGGKSYLQQAFDPATGSWSNVAPLPVALDHIQAVEVDGLIYYVGGLAGYPGTSYGNVYVYDPVVNSFTTAAPLPTGRDRGAGGIAVYRGKIYLAGGFHGGASVPWFDSYDPVTDAWTRLPDMPESRDHVSGAVIGDRFYVIGGRTFAQGLRPENDAYDFTSGSWVSGLAPIPTLRAGAATAVLGDEVAVIGGEGGGVAHSENEAYDTTTDTWRTLAPMPTARHGIQAVVQDGTAYIVDGGLKMGGGNPTDIQESFTLSPPAAQQPDCRVRLLNETALTGNNVYGVTGTGQTRSTTVAAGSQTTFVFSVQNDGQADDSMRLQGPGSGSGFSVRYLVGLTSTNDATARIVDGTYTTNSIAPGRRRLIRLEVTVASGTPAGAVGQWLLTAASTTADRKDACAGRVTSA